MRRGISFCIVHFTFCIVSACSRASVGPSVAVARVQSRMTSPEITATAGLAAHDHATIRASRACTAARVQVEIGAHVMRQDPLVQCDGTALHAQLNQLRAQRREAEAQTKRNQFLLEHRDELKSNGTMNDVQFAGLDSDVAQNDAKIARLDADIATTENALANLTIASPIDGLVVDQQIVAGQSVAADAVLFEIVGADPLVASFALTGDEADSLAVGDPLKIRIDELADESVDATVSFVGPELQMPNHTFTVLATLPNPTGRFKIGMTGFADFHARTQHQVFVVPASALVLRGGDPSLVVIVDGIARVRPVVVKSRSSDEIILVSGVAANDWIAIKGQEGLQDGAVVDMRR